MMLYFNGTFIEVQQARMRFDFMAVRIEGVIHDHNNRW